jgi:group I intron endonuclease
MTRAELASKPRRAAGIYIITNKSNGDCYIGASKTMYRRMADYTHPCRMDKPHSLAHLAIMEFGVDMFDFSVLESIPNATRQILMEREMYYIEKIQPLYNITKGGVGRKAPFPEYAKQLLREAGKKQWAARTEEEKAAFIKNNLKGPDKVVHSELTKSRISASLTGKKQSAETIKKRADALRGREKCGKPYMKKIDMYGPSGKFACTFNSIKEAAAHLGVSDTNVSKVLKGVQNSTKKHTFKYHAKQ